MARREGTREAWQIGFRSQEAADHDVVELGVDGRPAATGSLQP